ncbi:MAG: class I SAM-dependent methyltransferase [Chloroflexota bacterium]|nr:class I SAM-dependent methyltransferase [Chloroflexota bacterium]
MKTSEYDDYAAEYVAYVERREQGGAEGDPMGLLPYLLEVIGDVSGRMVLDAGCGEGYLARILAGLGARVTGVDLSPRLIALARAKDPDGEITYQVGDLSTPLPEHRERFDAVASYMVLDDVEDHRGFAATLAQVLKPGGRAVLAFNNPYAYVVRKDIGTDYFASGTTYPSGLARSGINVSFHYRTLGEYLDAFLSAGLQLTRLLDVDHPEIAADRAAGKPLPEGEGLPRFMVLAFRRPMDDPCSGS